jgi:hypothetical protein
MTHRAQHRDTIKCRQHYSIVSWWCCTRVYILGVELCFESPIRGAIDFHAVYKRVGFWVFVNFCPVLSAFAMDWRYRPATWPIRSYDLAGWENFLCLLPLSQSFESASWDPHTSTVRWYVRWVDRTTGEAYRLRTYATKGQRVFIQFVWS